MSTLHAIFDAVLGPAIVAVGAWVIKLGNRVSVVETKHDDLITLINSKFDGVDNQLEGVNGRLDRISQYLLDKKDN